MRSKYVQEEKMKHWATGIADEAWKITVCAIDAHNASELLSSIKYITGKSIEELKLLSGKDIIDALIKYQASALKSVEEGLKARRTLASETPDEVEIRPGTVGDEVAQPVA